MIRGGSPKAQLEMAQRDLAAIRHTILETLQETGGGHFGGSLSVVDILYVLYQNEMIVEVNGGVGRAERNRLILSKGHAAMALYAILAHFDIIEQSSLVSYGSAGSALQGHPDMTMLDAIDFSSGSLGQGLSVGLGMALALKEKTRGVWVILGDGECQEGQVWEAAMLAARLNTNNLWPIIDVNGFQEFGYGWVGDQRPPILSLRDKWRAFGWQILECDGHEIEELGSIIAQQQKADKPTVVIAKTTKGKGFDIFENNPAASHCLSLSDDQFREIVQTVKRQ